MMLIKVINIGRTIHKRRCKTMACGGKKKGTKPPKK